MPETTMFNLTDSDCWDLLIGHKFGRIAFGVGDEVTIVPINYVTDRDSRRLIFRTGENNKLLGVVLHTEVAFEIDDVKHGSAWSVIVRGRGHRLTGEEARLADALDLTPWVGADRYLLVAIDIAEMSGRHYPLIGRG